MEYVIVSIMSVLLGQVIKHLNFKMPPVVAEEITYKEYYSTLFKDFKIDIKYSLIMLIFSNILMYLNGNIYSTYIYIILFATLLIVFSIDYRFQLIPDESHIVIILLSIVNMIYNQEEILNYLLGALTGGGIFLIISLLALLIYRKEGMGFGDVKLMGALGLLFGVKNILVITLVSFFIGAIIGGFLMIINKKEGGSYIPFGPFIVIGTILIIFVDPDIIIDLYIGMCTGISNLLPI